jgi:ribonuclease P protein component
LKKTLNKCDKLRLRSEFEHVRESGNKKVGRFVVLVTATAPDGKLRCGVVCNRRYSVRAVIRNRARRLLWESFRLLKAQIVPCHMTLIVRAAMAGRKQFEVQKELFRLLKDANRIRADWNGGDPPLSASS